MRFLAVPRGDWRLIAGGAVLVGIAYPPFHLFVPTFICLVPATWLLMAGASDPAPFRRHLAQGFWFGLLAHGATLYWMVVALWHFTPLAAVAYAVTIVVLALWMSVVFALSGWITRRRRIGLLVTLPVVWTAAEWAVAHLADLRFPWLGLGTSLTGFPTAVQIADVVGARGVTFLVVLANVAIAQALTGRAPRRQALLHVSVVTGAVCAAFAYGIVRERTLPLQPVGTAALLQPNVGWSEKWDPARRDTVFRQTLRLAQRATEEHRPDLVVWPEVAVPDYLTLRDGWRRGIATLSRETGVTQAVGALDLEWLDRTERRYDYYNSAFVFDTTGRLVQRPYRKRYLVPVTERVPFLSPRWFDLEFFGGFRAGREAPLYRTALGRFGVLICFESVFENLSRRYRADGADFLVNVTNDAWFGRTSAPYQHAAHVVMRAIETRAAILRSANSGITEFVDPLGHQHQRTSLYERTVVTGEVVTSSVIPLYVRLGDWVGALSLVMTGMMVAAAVTRPS